MSAQKGPNTLIRLLACVVAFLALETLVFRTKLYSSILEPESSTGYMERRLKAEVDRPSPDPNQVLVVGDSRMVDLLPKLANETTPPTGYTFANISTPGATPRCWYYMIRAVDPHANRYSAVVLSSEDYDEADRLEDLRDRITDLSYLNAELNVGDLLEFTRSFRDPAMRFQVVRGILFKGFTYKSDFQAFLDHPQDRLDNVNLYLSRGAQDEYNYTGESGTLTGMTVDWTAREIHFPDSLPQAKRDEVRGQLFPPVAPQTGERTAYLKYWLNKIADYYQGSRTRLIVVRLARAPAVAPKAYPNKPDSAVRELGKRKGVILWDEHVLDELEKPEYFADGMHLNEEGLKRSSPALASAIRQALGSPQAR